jgi:cytochrome P450
MRIVSERAAMSDPAPLSPGALRAVLSLAARELRFGLPATSREIDHWRARAQAIPSQALRETALDAISRKRDNLEGAALFCVLPATRPPQLLRLLVAHQTLWDFLDSVTERYPSDDSARQLHLALAESLDPDAPTSDYYRHHSWKDDGGYVDELVAACREGCRALPSYSRVREQLRTGAEICGAVQNIIHYPDPHHRERALKAWAESQAGVQDLSWFELVAAAAGCVPYGLLALAAEPNVDELQVTRTRDLYFPLVSLLISMLDSYADWYDDRATGDHSCMADYPDIDVAVARVATLIDRAMRQARALPNGHAHAVIVACVVATIVTRDGAQAPEMRTRTAQLIDSGGSLTRRLMPVVRAWRMGCRKRGAEARPTHKEGTVGLPAGPRLPAPIQTWMLWKSPLIHLERCYERYGSRFTIRPTSRPPLVVLSDVDDIKAILTAAPDVLYPGDGAKTVEPAVGQLSFMLQDEAAHLNGRRIIMPPLRAKTVMQHAEIIGEIAQREIADWPRDVPLALHPRLRALTLRTALHTALGVAGRISERSLNELHGRLLEMLSITGTVVFSEPLLRHGPGRRLWTRFLRERPEVDEMLYEVMRSRDGSEEATDNVLDRLLQARPSDGSPMSPREIRDNLMSIILAGHETTASQLAWAFQLLAHNPKVCDRLIDEIKTDAGEKYLTATINEVIRHRPVFLFAIPRTVRQPIEITGRIYEPPAQLVGCTYLMHHDPAIYSEPHKFCPERFMVDPPAHATWLPWGGGRKRCPGNHLATLEMKIVLRTVLSTMTVNPVADTIEPPRWRSVIVTPASGSRVMLHPRRRVARYVCAGTAVAR